MTTATKNGYVLLEQEWLGLDELHRFRQIESGVEAAVTPRRMYARYARTNSSADKRNQDLTEIARKSGSKRLEIEWLGAIGLQPAINLDIFCSKGVAYDSARSRPSGIASIASAVTALVAAT